MALRARVRLASLGLAAVVAGIGAGPGPALALPPGRAWTPYKEMRIEGSVRELGAPMLDRDGAGLPYFLLQVHWDTAPDYRWATFGWRDTSWACVFRSTLPSFYLGSVVLQPGEERAMTWLASASPLEGRPPMVVGRFTADSVATPDSVFRTTTQSTEYAAAASARRRWVIRSEQRQPELEFHVRVFYSDTARIWREVGRLGVNEDHCTVAPLGDTTAIVVYAGLSGLEYAILDGARWTERGNLDRRTYNARNPRFRLRPSGGLWLFWADDDWMHMSSYRDGSWDRGDSLRCLPAPGETFGPAYLNAEHDTTEYPVFAWTNGGYGYTYRDMTAIAFPNGRGWDPGEEVPDSEMSGWIAPTMTTDLNGDVWLIWRRASEGVNRWIHTYCSATCAAPTVTSRGDGAHLSWALSSRAPGSRWTVLRSADGGAFDSLGTVRAGEDSVLVFDDPTAGPGASWRYRIRRESVDIRFRWDSGVSDPWPFDHRAPLGLALVNPTNDRLAFRLTSATGQLWARLYDLQGRVVLLERLAASGTGEDTFTLDLGASGARRPGIYFLRVADGTGRTTRTARVAVVR